ncbi:c6 zinc finger domain-containing [Fusarium albosuccineum]|uniref:C6 zinc finger domain-containing n=1 Tax=Fusarium albosuccineum TaxID=1237068 RepID=A0A8H4PJQ5_9HYPO|nr:c6 zinc finger domain-containing [Fusarium albosuccineum]
MARIGHKKSRNGCSRCKQRKIKCDERRPCGACAKWELFCSLSLPSPPSNHQDNPNPRPGTQLVRSPTAVAPAARLQLPLIAPVSSIHDVPNLVPGPRSEQQPGWTADLGLMNHYTSHTSATLPGASRRVWEVDIPRDAVTHPFLMHQILAVSAFHLATLDKPHSQMHLSRAFQHQHHTICGITAEVSSVTPRNCHALFAASSLLFMGAFAASAAATDKAQVDDILGVFSLVRGVGTIMNLSQHVSHEGILGEFMQCNAEPGSTGLLELLLEQLPQIHSSLNGNRLDHEADAIVKDAVFGLGASTAKASAATPELNVALIWPMTLKDGFLALLRAHNPAALVVAAHYCTVLHAAGSGYWFIRGWGHRLITAISGSLGPEWQAAIKWPLGYIASCMDSDPH